MRNLFKILNIENGEEKNSQVVNISLSDKNHLLFKAHFPNNEILAAFLQIDIIANILNHKIKKIKKAKFLSIIRPNDIIKYYISSQDTLSYKIIIKDFEEKKVSEFSYEI